MYHNLLKSCSDAMASTLACQLSGHGLNLTSRQNCNWTPSFTQPKLDVKKGF